MINFADEAVIEVRSGKGGNGCIAFRREKYIPKGGPNGGDGGKGGNVVFCVKRNMRTLSKLRQRRLFKAKNGGDGMGWNKYGKNGEDVIVCLPPGTFVKDAQTDELLYDFSSCTEEKVVFLEGGKGGWGNVHFKTSTNQAPRYANKGKEGISKILKLELNIIADVGLVGFPNAGKSSFLTAFTNARPKIAPYPFTTKIPYLGVLRNSSESFEEDIIIADIPGIIEGACEGAGMGFDFLKHISRTACLLFMIDSSSLECFEAYKILCRELKNYSENLSDKRRIVLCNKIDIEGAKQNAINIIEEIHKTEPETAVIPISVKDNTGMENAKKAIIKLVHSLSVNAVDKGVSASTQNNFMETRSVDESMEVQYPGSGQ